MKKLSLFLALGAAAAVVPGAANATHSGGAGPKHDFVAGTGHGAAQNSDLHVNAKSGPTGQGAQGHFFSRFVTLTGREIDIRGRVTCLRVNGNDAVWGGVVEQSRTPVIPEGAGVIGRIFDGGEPGAGRDRRVLIPGGPPPTQCTDPGFPGLPIDQGNYVVHDG